MITKVTILKVNRFAIHTDFFSKLNHSHLSLAFARNGGQLFPGSFNPNTVCYDAMKAPSTIPNVVIPELKSHDTLN